MVTEEAEGSKGEVGGRGRGRGRGRESREGERKGKRYVAGLYLRGERRDNFFIFYDYNIHKDCYSETLYIGFYCSI